MTSLVPRLLVQRGALLAACGCAGLAVSPAEVSAAHAVELRGGAEVRGTLLAEKADRVFLDLGFTVLNIPREEIVSLVETGAEVVEAADPAVLPGDLFRTGAGAGPERSVRENVERVAEAVVQVRTPIGLGSGFIVHPSGYVITNEHVVAGENRISVTLFRRGGSELERVNFTKVRIVALDSRQDLALLKIEEPGEAPLPTVQLGDSGGLTDGQTVFAIGSPLGLDRTVSQGIISLRNRVMDGQLYIQTTTQINPGNSGGPLFNLRGEVVGVNNMKAMLVGIEGLNFSIPAATLKSFLRNRDAFAFDPRNPNAGFRYLEPPRPGVVDGSPEPVAPTAPAGAGRP